MRLKERREEKDYKVPGIWIAWDFRPIETLEEAHNLNQLSFPYQNLCVADSVNHMT